MEEYKQIFRIKLNIVINCFNLSSLIKISYQEKLKHLESRIKPYIQVKTSILVVSVKLFKFKKEEYLTWIRIGIKLN